MKNTVLRYGLYSAITLGGLFILGFLIGKNLDYSAREVYGYASMVLSLMFVFFGIKHYRDKENNGAVSFGKGLLIGVLISLIAALAFGIIDVIYIEYINPDFVTEYYEHQVETLRTTLPEEEFQERFQEMESQKAFFSSTALNFLVMFMTVFVLGFIISLISALILQRKN